jgi:hypothetical protein
MLKHIDDREINDCCFQNVGHEPKLMFSCGTNGSIHQVDWEGRYSDISSNMKTVKSVRHLSISQFNGSIVLICYEDRDTGPWRLHSFRRDPTRFMTLPSVALDGIPRSVTWTGHNEVLVIIEVSTTLRI